MLGGILQETFKQILLFHTECGQHAWDEPEGEAEQCLVATTD